MRNLVAALLVVIASVASLDCGDTCGCTADNGCPDNMCSRTTPTSPAPTDAGIDAATE